MTDKTTAPDIRTIMAKAHRDAPLADDKERHEHLSINKMQAAIDALLAAGFVIVPMEPTEAMVNKGGQAQCHHFRPEGSLNVGGDGAKSVYAAMLSAHAADIAGGEKK